MIITIDGPVASGKSTAAQLLAQHIGFYHLSSGLLFRALAYILKEHAGYIEATLYTPAPSDIAYYLDPARFICVFDEAGKLNIFFEGNDIVPLLKQKGIDHYASIIATNKAVRQAMISLQQTIAQSYNLVVDGRDSGSVVFPNASIKFFLTASVEIRAFRWQQEQKKYSVDLSLQEALEQIKSRDERDKKRRLSPLIIPEGAVIIDNSNYSVQETITIMELFVQQLFK